MSEEQIAVPTSPFNYQERAFLGRAQRFLVNVADQRIGRRAARSGYNAGEHQLGWQLLGKAAGMQRSFDHYLSAAEQQIALSDSDEVKGAIKELDDFENTWFVRSRNAIRRFVKDEAVEQAFFDNLSQQPEGPNVVGSVELLLKRLEGLKSSGKPGAAKAYASLVNKGLDAATVSRMHNLIAQAKGLQGSLAPAVSEQEQQAAAQEQREAYDELKLWYIDWADTLRDKLDYHAAVRLGLRKVRGGYANTPGEEIEAGGSMAGELDATPIA